VICRAEVFHQGLDAVGIEHLDEPVVEETDEAVLAQVDVIGCAACRDGMRSAALQR
jgi:hypothetical protein